MGFPPCIAQPLNLPPGIPVDTKALPSARPGNSAHMHVDENFKASGSTTDHPRVFALSLPISFSPGPHPTFVHQRCPRMDRPFNWDTVFLLFRTPFVHWTSYLQHDWRPFFLQGHKLLLNAGKSSFLRRLHFTRGFETGMTFSLSCLQLFLSNPAPNWTVCSSSLGWSGRVHGAIPLSLGVG
eukprot:scaffold2682_cov344-Pavlova_lutheri.AAC.30